MGNGIWCIIIAFLINIYYARTISITITLPSAASPSPVMENHSQAYGSTDRNTFPISSYPKALKQSCRYSLRQSNGLMLISAAKFLISLRQSVSKQLRSARQYMIYYGQTMTYGEIANIIAKQNGVERMSSQAVGGAVGHNPVSIIIPCHRVVGADGSLTGYAGGLDRKIELLKLEKVI